MPGEFKTDIKSVKLQGDAYLVNGNLNVPADPLTADYRAVMEWIAKGNKPEPEFTPEQIKNQKWNEILEQRDLELTATNPLCFADAWEDFTPAQRYQIKSFRDALRSIGKDEKVDPENVVFPDVPDTIKGRMDTSIFKRKERAMK